MYKQWSERIIQKTSGRKKEINEKHNKEITK